MSEQEITLEDGTQPRPLDVLEIGLTKWSPDEYQQENHLLDTNTPWRRVGRYTWQQAAGLPILPYALWVDGRDTYNGIKYGIPEIQAAELTDSLRLARSQVTIRISTPYDPNKPLEVWAGFQHAGQLYRFKVTDPIVEDRFRPQGIGDYTLGDSILTISLGEKWKGEVYKLVAAIIENPQYS